MTDEICILCGMEDPQGGIAAHFEQCFDEYLPVVPAEVPDAVPSAHLQLFFLHDHFPMEVVMLILKLLDAMSLGGVLRVNKAWRYAAHATLRRRHQTLLQQFHSFMPASMQHCDCRDSLRRHMPPAATEAEVGKAVASLERDLGLPYVRISVRTITGYSLHWEVKGCQQAPACQKYLGSVMTSVTVGDLLKMYNMCQSAPMASTMLLHPESSKRLMHYDAPLIAYVATHPGSDIQLEGSVAYASRNCVARSLREWCANIEPTRQCLDTRDVLLSPHFAIRDRKSLRFQGLS